jgi:hypothetical protein
LAAEEEVVLHITVVVALVDIFTKQTNFYHLEL